MGLFPELDEKKTIDNVKNYFKKEFPRLKARSHMNLTNIQSPSFDSVGSGGSFRNHQEDKIVQSIWTKEYVKATYQIIENCPRKYMLILKHHYLYEETNEQTMDKIGLESTAYNDSKNKALLYFADAFIDFEDLQVLETGETAVNWRNSDEKRA